MGLLGVIGVTCAIAAGTSLIRKYFGAKEAPITVVAQSTFVLGTTQLIFNDIPLLLGVDVYTFNLVWVLTTTAMAYVDAYHKVTTYENQSYSKT